MKKALLMILAGCCFVACAGQTTLGEEAENLVMPTELNELAVAHGYRQVSNFYSIRPGGTNAPFVYWYDDKSDLYPSAAFWCRKAQDTTALGGPYFLLVATEDNFLSGLKVVAEIEWHLPYGLYILRDSTISLSSFAYVDERGYVDENSEPGPEGAYMVGNAIAGSYKDDNVIFYEYQGRWLVRWSYGD